VGILNNNISDVKLWPLYCYICRLIPLSWTDQIIQLSDAGLIQGMGDTSIVIIANANTMIIKFKDETSK